MTSENQYKKVESYRVPILEKEVRLLDHALDNFVTLISKSGIKKAIKKGLVKVNGETGYTSDYIKGGEVIELYQDSVNENKPIIDLDIDVVYEDDFLAIINKPAGIIVSGNKKRTLENSLTTNLFPSKQKDALQRPEPIHRLDYPTSGVLLVGKTKEAVVTLNRLFEERNIEKKYHAVVIGKIKEEGSIDEKIDDKVSKTTFKVLKRVVSEKYEFLNLAELIPFTGRRHQLRKHLSGIGNPILGDKEYGKEGLILKGKGLFLHASSLKFLHPVSGIELFVKIPLPKKMIKLFPE